MSSIYHTEPPTQGKVVIKTTFGDIDIELWPKEAPLACRNFIQLALEGYYDHTEVNRVVKSFMVQMGDPSGSGTGGTSIWGRPFKDEIHGRIKFNHRGQVAMANANKPHSNQSQFFVTLDACEWLNGKHTIFGKVTGSTIFNVIRMGESETDGNDRPVDVIRILSIEVLSNPFDDIVPRITKKVDVAQKSSELTAESHVKAVKDAKLLSFGDEEEEEEETTLQVKFRSIHDLKSKNKKSGSSKDRNLESKSSKDKNPSAENDDTDDQETKAREAILKKNVEHLQKQNLKMKQSVKNDDDAIADDDIPLDRDTLTRLAHEGDRASEIKQKSEEFLKARADLLKTRRAVNVLTGAEAVQKEEERAYREMYTPLEQRRMKYVKRKSDFGDRSQETLAKLQKFTASLRATKSMATDKNEKSEESYHGQVLEDETGKEELGDWFVGKLRCKKHIDEQYRHGAGNERKTDDYVVIDPRQQFSS